jgi:ATP-dependent exoDNAse (exonuclease V) beta subunit
MKPEIIYGLPFSEYCELDALNQSKLKYFKRTPLHARHDLLSTQADSKELLIGHAVHAMVLEPEDFVKNYAVFDDSELIKQVMRSNPETKSPRATKMYKDAQFVWQAKYAAHAQLTQQEFDRCKAIRAAVMGHPVSKEILSGEGESELTMIWELPIKGDGFAKARIDRLTRWNGINCVIDLKTWNPKDKDAILDEKSVSRQIHQYGYHNQASWYREGLQQLAPARYAHILIFVEQEHPHDVAVYELSEEAIAKGAEENARYYETWSKCRKTGVWPGVSNVIKTIGLPQWAN